ncbi:hypothetical protein H7F37_03635 [Winogradskyella sp. PAMC22761]|nr:hypothetical protein H7F37_03635 [Winogradskyella sp. PAMC22761]
MKNTYSRKVNLSFIGNIRVNFYGISCELIKIYENENEFERQKSMKHLGVIADVLESSHHSRYEYLMLQCFLIDVIENTYKGTPNAIGSIKIDGKEYSGNSLIKTWFLLSNFGHTFKTIGDEKALLLFTNERKGFKSELINSIDDKELKDYAIRVIDSFDYPNFHHILTLWRVNKKVRDNSKKKQIIKIYKLFLLGKTTQRVNETKLELLKHLAYYAREIAIISIDGHNTHIPFTINPLSTLMSVDVYESKLKNKSVFNILDPLVTVLINEVYLNKDVLTKQKEYELNSINNIKTFPANRKSYIEIIEKAFNKGLKEKDEIELTHFFRFTINQNNIKRQSILNEYRNIQTVKRNCNSVEASLDFNPKTNEKVYDFFIDKKFKKSDLPTFLFNICQLLENQIKNTVNEEIQQYDKLISGLTKELKERISSESEINEIIQNSLGFLSSDVLQKINQKVLPAFRGLLSSIISYFLDSKYTFEITDTNIPYDLVGVSLSELNFNTIKSNIKKALKFEENEDRKLEIKQIEKLVPNNYPGYIICSMCRINIYDFSKSPNERIVTDIDSVIIKINKSELIIEFNETKNVKRNRENVAKKDLKDKFIQTLNDNAKGYRNNPVKGFGAKIRIKINVT